VPFTDDTRPYAPCPCSESRRDTDLGQLHYSAPTPRLPLFCSFSSHDESPIAIMSPSCLPGRLVAVEGAAVQRTVWPCVLHGARYELEL